MKIEMIDLKTCGDEQVSWLKCSNCGEEIPDIINHLNYCPCCGNIVKGSEKDSRKRPPEVRERIRQSMKKKPVVQLTLDGEYIATFESLRAAERHTGIHEGAISNACIGKTAGGYRWKYADESTQ